MADARGGRSGRGVGDRPRTAVPPDRGGALRFGPLPAALLLALLALLGVATPAVADPVGATSPPASGKPGGAAPAAVPTQAALLAGALRRDPVYVTDQLPRVVPRSTVPAFARAARATGVPTFVLVLPDQSAADDSLLGAVHDRLGRDGLYVLVDTLGVAEARAFGVRADADDAVTVALYALPYDAGPLRAFQRFAAAVAAGPDKAAAQADLLRQKYGESGREVPRDYIDSTDRANQSFVTGIALTGAPLSVLLVGWYVRRRRRARRADKGGGGRLPLPEFGVAVVLAAAVLVTSPRVFDQKVDSAAPPPTRADLTSRVDRVAAGLRRDAVYSDPESPQVLDAADLAELHRRIAAFTTGPVRVLLVPQLPDDESDGDSEAFVTAVHARLAALGGGAAGTSAGRGAGGVYVVADPLGGDIDVYDYGLPLEDDRLVFELPGSIAHDDASHPADDHRLAARLDRFMDYLAKVPHGEPSSGPDQPPAPVDDHRLPKLLFHGDFGPGMFVGALAAGALLGLVAACTAIAAAVVRSRRTPHAPGAGEPAHPSAAHLARTARHEADALATELEAAGQQAEGRAEAWECLDAALLLLDGGEGQETAEEHTGTGPSLVKGGTDDGLPGAVLAHDGVSAADLAAAVVLARAARAALAGRGYDRCCAVNPLHGPAEPSPGDGSSGGRPPRQRPSAEEPLCAACAAAARAAAGPAGRVLDRRRLALPGPGGSWVPYRAVPGPLPSVRDGMRRLVAATREYVHVQ